MSVRPGRERPVASDRVTAVAAKLLADRQLARSEERAVRALLLSCRESESLRRYCDGLPAFATWLYEEIGAGEREVTEFLAGHRNDVLGLSGSELLIQYLSENGLVIDRRGVVRIVTVSGFIHEVPYNKDTGMVDVAELEVAIRQEEVDSFFIVSGSNNANRCQDR